MQWETWVEECREKNPGVNPRKWLEATVDQNVMMREESMRAVGDLLSGKSVSLNAFRAPSYTTDPQAYNQIPAQIFLWGGNLSTMEVEETDRHKAIITSEGRHRPVIAEAPEPVLAVCLAAVEYADLAMGADLDQWIKDVLREEE